MASFKGNKLYIHGSGLKTGILFTNLGTPDEPTAPSLKTYLKTIFLMEESLKRPKLFGG
jgi:ferrochelatase